MELLEQCQQWFEQDEAQKVIDALEAIPAGERTPELDSELAKAYIAVAEIGEREPFEKALELLAPHEEYFAGDHCWNYRIASAYYLLDEEGPALRYFEKALEARPGDEDTQQFIEWCQESYEAVYAVEPNPRMRGVCREHFQDNAKIQFYPCALWNRQERLRFENRGSKWDARVCSLGQVLVDADTIDHIIGAHRVSLIKLDVEGSEMEALEGARQCIQRDKPRLAVSIYHKPEDMDNICGYLLSIVPDYRFSIRHYHSDAIETILYGFTE